MRFGLPYQGSKSKFAPWILDHLPDADVLVEPFAGGCAFTHCALLSGKFRQVIANDRRPMVDFFLRSVKGEYQDRHAFVGREHFHNTKKVDLFNAQCFSFGPNGISYLYGCSLEPYKLALHDAVVNKEYERLYTISPRVCDVIKGALQGHETMDDRRLAVSGLAKSGSPLHAVVGELQLVNTIDALCKLDHILRINRVNSLIGLDISALTPLQKDYTEIEIPRGAVIYCDPPYEGTSCACYKCKFDFNSFLTWCHALSKTNDVFVSSYKIDDDRVRLASERSNGRSFGLRGRPVVERLYKVI